MDRASADGSATGSRRTRRTRRTRRRGGRAGAAHPAVPALAKTIVVDSAWIAGPRGRAQHLTHWSDTWLETHPTYTVEHVARGGVLARLASGDFGHLTQFPPDVFGSLRGYPGLFVPIDADIARRGVDAADRLSIPEIETYGGQRFGLPLETDLSGRMGGRTRPSPCCRPSSGRCSGCSPPGCPAPARRRAADRLRPAQPRRLGRSDRHPGRPVTRGCRSSRRLGGEVRRVAPPPPGGCAQRERKGGPRSQRRW
jgi:hypothetical protein